MTLDQYCDECRNYLSQDIMFWKSIHLITNKHSYPSIEEGIDLHKVSEADRLDLIKMPL